jgi:Mechanosensitive ion channel
VDGNGSPLNQSDRLPPRGAWRRLTRSYGGRSRQRCLGTARPLRRPRDTGLLRNPSQARACSDKQHRAGVGFFVALAALGVDFTKVTILAGAFTVGVGFGLQTVINNFVCGLILLFERPIKVGDVVQVDTDIGEVRRIGIRACFIRTAEGSEIIVPNGTIISNKVTNWTYSDRYRAVEVPVSVARGVDCRRSAFCPHQSVTGGSRFTRAAWHEALSE